jgi:hypothetical protein
MSFTIFPTKLGLTLLYKRHLSFVSTLTEIQKIKIYAGSDYGKASAMKLLIPRNHTSRRLGNSTKGVWQQYKVGEQGQAINGHLDVVVGSHQDIAVGSNQDIVVGSHNICNTGGAAGGRRASKQEVPRKKAASSLPVRLLHTPLEFATTASAHCTRPVVS